MSEIEGSGAEVLCFSGDYNATECGPSVLGTLYLVNETMPIPEIALAAKNLVQRVVNLVLFFIPLALDCAAQDMTNNQLQGILALECALTSGFAGSWRLLASATLVARFLGMQDDIQQYANEFNPHLCQCELDIYNLRSDPSVQAYCGSTGGFNTSGHECV